MYSWCTYGFWQCWATLTTLNVIRSNFLSYNLSERLMLHRFNHHLAHSVTKAQVNLSVFCEWMGVCYTLQWLFWLSVKTKIIHSSTTCTVIQGMAWFVVGLPTGLSAFSVLCCRDADRKLQFCMCPTCRYPVWHNDTRAGWKGYHWVWQNQMFLRAGVQTQGIYFFLSL